MQQEVNKPLEQNIHLICNSDGGIVVTKRLSVVHCGHEYEYSWVSYQFSLALIIWATLGEDIILPHVSRPE